MAVPVTVVSSGGRAVTEATNGFGEPMTQVSSGGQLVTIMASGGAPVVWTPAFPTGGGLSQVVAAFRRIAGGGVNVNAIQGVAVASSYRFTTSGTAAGGNRTIYTWDTAWAAVTSRDTSVDNGGAHAQINGLYYDATAQKLYAGANNFPTTPALGWIYEYDVAGNGSLSFVAAHAIGTGFWVEGCAKYGGYFWVVGHNLYEIHQYDTSWTLVQAHTLPGTSPIDGSNGGNLYQSIAWLGNVAYMNLHGSNTRSPRMDAFRWTGSGFSQAATGILPPTNDCTQGFVFDPDGVTAWLAERVANDSNAAAHVVKASFLYAPDTVIQSDSLATTATPPTGWTPAWVTSGSTWVGNSGGNGYARISPGSAARRALTFDAAGADKTHVEVLAKVRSDTTGTAGTTMNGPGVVARVTGTAAAETGWFARLHRDTTAGLVLFVGNYAAGVAATPASGAQAFAWSANTWYWIRFRLMGKSIKARVWADGGAEPSTWNVDFSDAAIPRYGSVGIISAAASGNQDFDYFSAAFDGTTAT